MYRLNSNLVCIYEDHLMLGNVAINSYISLSFSWFGNKGLFPAFLHVSCSYTHLIRGNKHC